MKIFIKLCLVWSVVILTTSSIQAQVSMTIQRVDDNCFDVIATVPTTVDMITVSGTNGGDYIMSRYSTTCQGTICFNGIGGIFGVDSPLPAGTEVTINCAAHKRGEDVERDGCIVVIGPG